MFITFVLLIHFLFFEKSKVQKNIRFFGNIINVFTFIFDKFYT